MATMEITTRIGCKNMCSYCPQQKLIGKYKEKRIQPIWEMPFSTFKKCIDKIPKNVRIDFSGFSEPWLNDDCTKMIQYAKERGFVVQIYTTGVNIFLEDIKKLEKMKFDRFKIHLPDSMNETKINVDAPYLKTLKELCKSTIPNKEFTFFKTLHPKVEEVLKKEGIIPKDESIGLISRAGSIFPFKKKLKQSEKLICILSKNKFDHNILLPDGTVVLCCMDYGLKHQLGNLLNQKYSDLFNNKEILKLKEGCKNSKIDILCRRCENAMAPNSINYKKYLIKQFLKNKFPNISRNIIKIKNSLF